MNKSPAFQWYPKDIISSARVAEMSLEEEGAYRRAIDFCWINGSLPNDAERLARIIGKGCTNEIATIVQRMFNEDPKDATRLIHENLEREREKQRKWSESGVNAGKASGEARRKAKEIKELQSKQKMNGRSISVERPLNDSRTLQSSSSITLKEESNTNVLPKKVKPIPKFEQFPIPRPDADESLWNGYLESRSNMKKPLTVLGYENLKKDLAKVGEFDLNRRLADAIERKWQGLIFKDDFTNGANGNGKSKLSSAERSAKNGRDGDDIVAALRAESERLRQSSVPVGLLGDGNGVGKEVAGTSGT